MELKDDVVRWLEKKNPSLLLMRGKERQSLLQNPKKIALASDTEVLIVKGVDKAFYEPALEKGIKVLLIEDDEGKIISFLQKESFTPHENLFLSKSDKEGLFPILKKFVFKKVQEEGDLSSITSYIGGIEMSFSEYRDLGKNILPNILSNLIHSNEYIDGRELLGCLDGEEVLICGSGISIEGAIEEIKKMKKRPYIFSVGSSLPLLLQLGIIPDFFVAIDPFPPEKLYSCIKDVSIPIFYQNRTARDLLFLYTGPKIFMGSSRGWQIEEAMLQEMGRESFFFDAGSNAGNFGAHIALSLGCKKVVLAGMDGVARDGEEATLSKGAHKTRADLLFGMDFFKELQENFPEAEILHYTKGLSFEGSNIIDKIVMKPKEKMITLPSPCCYDNNESKKVIERYFDHEMLLSLSTFLGRIHDDNSKLQVEAACIIAEFSLEPFYLNFMLPLWEVWKFLMPKSEEILSELAFYYNLLKSFSAKTGYDHDEFYLFGKREGRYFRNDKNGILREEGCFYQGKEEEKIKIYDRDGRLHSFQEMEKGLRHGGYEVYSGKYLIRKGEFLEGKPHGRHLCFYDGAIIDDVTYERGKKCGVHKQFSHDGYKRSEIIYHKEGDFFDRFNFDSGGQKVYAAIWKGGVFFEKRYDGGKEISSREGKIIGGKMIFKGER